MAPSLQLFPRQFGGPPGDRNNNDNNNRGFSTWAVAGIIATAAIVVLAVSILICIRMRSRRRNVSRISNNSINLHSTIPPKTGPGGSTYAPPPGKPNTYGGSAGYQATPDQNQSLLGNAEAPAIVAWDADHVGSTQNGFGYNAGAGIQRPASVASFAAPPPRYEEAAAAGSLAPGAHGQRRYSETGLRPLMLGQGEAASYYNPSTSGLASSTRAVGGEERERGRSATREGPGARSPSVETRSANGGRPRSTSRFREEGMVDLDVGKR